MLKERNDLREALATALRERDEMRLQMARLLTKEDRSLDRAIAVLDYDKLLERTDLAEAALAKAEADAAVMRKALQRLDAADVDIDSGFSGNSTAQDALRTDAGARLLARIRLLEAFVAAFDAWDVDASGAGTGYWDGFPEELKKAREALKEKP